MMPAGSAYWSRGAERRQWEEQRLIRTAPFTAEWNAAVEERRGLREPSAHGVYFVEAVGTGFVKIGRSKDIRTRIAQLRSTNGAILRLLRWENGGAREEKALHERWAGLRSHGEWFIVSAGMAFYMGALPGAAIARHIEGGGIWWETAA
jgi:hypothetical protein